ncbi:hypothetical protein KY284_002658 [Solanum tuberosum]|nr:hypothetical protein KY284_002658 [Solanum tuberosum]
MTSKGVITSLGLSGGNHPSSTPRASQTSLPNHGENNGSTPLHPEPLNVAPISCVPYTGPPLPYSYHTSASPDINTGSVPVEADSKHISSQQHAGGQPAMIFFTACPAREEWDNLINYANGGVALTGSALLGKVGPLIGSVDIAESEDDYVFRVSLPGVARDERVFRCDVGPNGAIVIKGVSETGENMVRRDNMDNRSFKGYLDQNIQLDGRREAKFEKTRSNAAVDFRTSVQL